MKIIKNLSYGITSNGNYSLSLDKNEVLCLNKRLVQLGVGICTVYGFAQQYENLFIKEIKDLRGITFFSVIGYARLYNMKDEQLKTIFNVLLPLHLGIAAGVGPHLGQLVRAYISFYIILLNSFGRGLGVFLGFYLLISSIALLIKNYGSAGIRKGLNYFNHLQDNLNLYLRNNGKYSLAVLNNEFLSFKENLLKLIVIISSLVMWTISDIESLVYKSAYYVVGSATIYSQLNGRNELIYLLLVAITLLEKKVFRMQMDITMFLGQGIMLTGLCFGMLGTISLLIKRSGNKQLGKFAEYIDRLKDKSKLKEYKPKIDQGELHKMRQDWMKSNKNIEYNSFNKSKNEEKKKIHEKIERTKEKSKKEKIREALLEKSAAQAPNNVTKKEYQVNLNSGNQTTWDQLFNITTSKPEHLVIKANAVKSLIVALGGEVKKNNNLKNIYFADVKLGYYEITHKSDRSKCLTSNYAQNVKKAIVKAIDAGYVNNQIVSIV